MSLETLKVSSLCHLMESFLVFPFLIHSSFLFSIYCFLARALVKLDLEISSNDYYMLSGITLKVKIATRDITLAPGRYYSSIQGLSKYKYNA